MRKFLSSIFVFAAASVASAAPALLHDFKVPPGFEVTRYADNDLTGDIYSMTIDSRGRVVVSGQGFVKALEDGNLDGVADKGILFTDFFKYGARGMYFEGNDLIAVGGGGVWRFVDVNGDAMADGEPESILKGLEQAEHGANGIIKGPDGWYYVVCGNDAGVSTVHASLPGSPVKQVQAGAVVRFPVDGLGSEVVAHGLRNPYDLAFGPLGHLFTVDSDSEQDQFLPWYSPTRVFDLAPGRHHGWVTTGGKQAWNRPAYWMDVADRTHEIGRGSPTGVVAYRHDAFPAKYARGVFSLCWTYGRLYFFALQPSRSTYSAEMETFLEYQGSGKFLPVGMAVHPNGDLFIASGGKGEGSVYRVHFTGTTAPAETADFDSLKSILSAPQPLASWSRALWVPRARAVGRTAFERAVVDRAEQFTIPERVRAIEVLVEVFGGIDENLARKSHFRTDPELSMRGIWALSRSEDSEKAHQFFAEMTHEKDLGIQCAAWEALAAAQSPYVTLQPQPDWMRGLDSTDNRIRGAAIQAAKGPGFISFDEVINPRRMPVTPRQWIGFLQVYGPEKGPSSQGPEWTSYYWRRALQAFQDTRFDSERMDAVRLLQLALGDVQVSSRETRVTDGYVAAQPERVSAPLKEEAIKILIAELPTNSLPADMEIVRLLAMLEVEDSHLLDLLGARWGDGTRLHSDLHYLLCATRLTGKRSNYFTQRTAHALAMLHQKVRFFEYEVGRDWPARVAATYAELQKLDPRLAQALVDDQAFQLPEQELFVEQMPESLREAARRKLSRGKSASR